MSDVTLEEAQKILEDLGVKGGDWLELEQKLTAIPGIAAQGKNLVRLRNFLESIAAADQKRLASLKEQLARLRYGGGA